MMICRATWLPAPKAKAAPKPRAAAKPKTAGAPPVEAAPEPEVASPITATTRVKIFLSENDEIPPTGLFVGLNGRGYLLRAGEEIDVPVGVLEILENAVTSVPQVDPQTRQVVGYRNRLRYPFVKRG
jgi:hypothetical protein